MNEKTNRFPVLDSHKYPDCPRYIRRDALSEEWAKYNHSQSLDQLAERHGLGVVEIYWNVNKMKITWGKIDASDEAKALELVRSLWI